MPRVVADGKCPAPGCKMDVGSLKKHLETHHIPGLFHQIADTSELQSRQFQALRRHALEMMAGFLAGRGARVEDLVEIVNQRMTPQDSYVSSDYRRAMEALAKSAWWSIPNEWRVCPLNSPAALIHWRPLLFILSELKQADRREIFDLFGERWTIPVETRKKRRNRPNPATRRKMRAELAQDSGLVELSPAKKPCPSSDTSSPREKPMVQSPPRPVTTAEDRAAPENTDHAKASPVLRDQGEVVPMVSLSAFPVSSPTLALTLEPSVQLGESAQPSPTQVTISLQDEEALLASPETQAPAEEPMKVVEVPVVTEVSTNVTAKSASAIDRPMTYAEACKSKGSTIAKVAPRMTTEVDAAFDSHFHLDRLSRELHLPMEEATILHQHEDNPPKEPVTLHGGVMVFCDPKEFDRIPKGMDKKWRIAVGVHPKKVKDLTPSRMDQLKKLLSHSAALGEIGLDYSRGSESDRQSQVTILENLLPLCESRHVLVLHVRGSPEDKCSTTALQECLELVRKHVDRLQRIHLHCFSGNQSQVNAWRKAFPRCYFGFTGLVASFNLEQREGLRAVPWERLLIETDSPYLAVREYRPNTPAYVGEVASHIAFRRLASTQAVLEQTTKNALALY